MSTGTSPRGRVRTRLAVIAATTVATTGLLPLIGAHAVDPGKNGSVAFISYNEVTACLRRDRSE